MLNIGLSHTSTTIVNNSNTARTYGSGGLDVFATPAMIGLMENAAMTGIDFFPSLPNKIEKRAEAEVDFTKWTVNLQVKKKN